MRRVFLQLDERPYLGEAERREFRRYDELFERDLARIAAKIASGRLTPIDLSDFPQVLNYPGYAARVGIFIGSFDPFQMTHLGAALRFLASDSSEADLVFVVPEGSANPTKPNKTEYHFRYDLLRLQLEGIFSPLVVPLDLGEGADTIGIVERLIDLHPGGHLKLTHLIGSDSLPTATLLLPEDLAAWRERARIRSVELDHGIHVEKRHASDEVEPYASAIRGMGSRFAVDEEIVDAPSSSDFRASRNFTIVFPSDAVLSRLELLFRYGLNRPWMTSEVDGTTGTIGTEGAGGDEGGEGTDGVSTNHEI
jgi:hypothetical protein